MFKKNIRYILHKGLKDRYFNCGQGLTFANVLIYPGLKDASTYNGAYSSKSGFKNGGGGQQMQPLVKSQVPMAVDGGYPMGATGGYDDVRNQS